MFLIKISCANAFLLSAALQGGSTRHKIHRTSEKTSFLALTHAAVLSLALVCITPHFWNLGVFGLSLIYIAVLHMDEMTVLGHNILLRDTNHSEDEPALSYE